MSYILKHYYLDDNGNVTLTGEFGNSPEFKSKYEAILAALDAATTWVKMATFIYSSREGVAILRQDEEGNLDSVMEFPAIFSISPLHRLIHRASAEEYSRAVDELCATGACEWEDLGTGRRYRYSDETQKHLRLESSPPVDHPYEISAEQAAKNELDRIIDNCCELLNAATKIKNAITTRDIETIRESLKAIQDRVERRSHRIVIGPEPGDVYALLEELEAERECALAKEAACEAGVDPDHEAAWDAHVNNLAALDPAYEQYEIAREALAG